MTALLAVVLVAFPFVIESAYWSLVGLVAVVGAMVGLSLVVLAGWVGLVSFAHATLLGIGAYSAFHFAETDLPFPLILVLSGLVTAGIAIVMGVPGIRLRGISLAALTLAFAAVGDGFIFTNRWFTGGVDSGAALPKPSLFGLEIATDRQLYLLVLAVYALFVVMLRNVNRGATGRAFHAVRGSEPGAIASGLNPDLVKIEAFALSGFVVGVAGAAFAFGIRSLSTYGFSVPASLNLFVISVVGGVQHLLGSVFTGFIYAFGPAIATELEIKPDWVLLATGVFLIPALRAGLVGAAGAPLRFFGTPERPILTGRAALAPEPPQPAAAPALTEPNVLLAITELTHTFGGVTALDDVGLSVTAGGVTALIGPNGAGKSTLFRIVTGQYRPDRGGVRFEGADLSGPAYSRSRIGIGWTYQSNQVFPDLTVVENALVSLHRHRARDLGSDILRLGPARRHEAHLIADALQLLDLVGIRDHADELARGLPFGTLRRLEIARALALRPRLLLLDEPATGLNPDETRALAALLRHVTESTGMSMLIIEHDMALVGAVADYVYVLDSGRVIAHGLWDEIRVDERVVRVYLGQGPDPDANAGGNATTNP
ncbi:MAG: ATP-binding cassette domain-containing protein [Acidimicrobiales bacterium]|nr:ATP-binding cassette domain-containing protein [Acidimicrobiales bacterium]